MAAIKVDSGSPFGAMSNQLIVHLTAADGLIKRLEAAAANAASGYSGTAGTEFEGTSNFGIEASATAGAQGTAWRFAIDSLNTAWNTFQGSASGAIATLDNGPPPSQVMTKYIVP